MTRGAFIKLLGQLITVVMLLLPLTSPAQQQQSPATIQHAIENFLRVETGGLPGTVTFDVGGIDPRVTLPVCPVLEVYQPAGARLWGSTTVGVRCGGPQPWNIYVATRVKVVGPYLILAQPLPQGQMIGAADLATQNGDLTELPSGVLTNIDQAIGKTLAVSLTAGQPLRQDMLRTPLAVQQGQAVKLQSAGQGFKVSNEGRALNNAYAGQVTQVRTLSGQTVSGIAQNGGLVEIRN